MITAVIGQRRNDVLMEQRAGHRQVSFRTGLLLQPLYVSGSSPHLSRRTGRHESAEAFVRTAMNRHDRGLTRAT
jgi:hypothetical protein